MKPGRQFTYRLTLGYTCGMALVPQVRRVEWSLDRWPKRSLLIWVPDWSWVSWVMRRLGFLRVRRSTKAAEAFMREMGCPSAIDPAATLARPTPPETPRAKERRRKE